MIKYIENKIIKASDNGVEVQLNWFDKKIGYIDYWIDAKLYGIKFWFIQRNERIIAERTSKIKPLDKRVHDLMIIVWKEVSNHQKIRRMSPTYIGVEGIMFNRILKLYNIYSEEKAWAKLHSITRFLYKKLNKKINFEKFQFHHNIPTYYNTDYILSEQKIIICSKGNNIKFILTEPTEEEKNKEIDLFTGPVTPTIELKQTKERGADLVTEIYFNQDFTVKEIITKEI